MALLKPERWTLGAPMIGISAIVIFLVVIGALNLYEFGRLD
ncbi:MAG: hypothetical protein JWQ97_722 [Phenylobacterium sp.]|nr:hypothetical protein [Phenylobacterium sp.]